MLFGDCSYLYIFLGSIPVFPAKADVPERTYYDVEELGLSVEAAGNLYSKKADARVVNELLINEKFLLATKQLAAYFTLTEKYIRTMEKKALAKLNDMMNDGKVL